MFHGAITGALSTGGNTYIKGLEVSDGIKILASSILGGTVSEIGGGKFANGAMTAAYTMMFNDLMHDGDDGDNEKSSSIVTSELEERGGVYYLNGHIIGEKPMGSIWPEFDALVRLRYLANFIGIASSSVRNSVLELFSSTRLNISDHALKRINQRGFSKKDIIRIMEKGTKTIGKSKYGERQYRYTYRGNTVIQNMNDGKIVTVFSNSPKIGSTPKGYKIPF